MVYSLQYLQLLYVFPILFITIFFSTSSNSKDISVTIKKNAEKQWLDSSGNMGAQFDGVIINNSNKKITNWKVELTVPEKSEIDSSWNGIYIKDNQKISITAPLEYNTSISSHSSITFGFIFYTTPSYEPTSFSIDYEVQSNITEYMFFWFMLFILFGLLVALITSIFLRMRIKVLKRAELKDKYFIDQTLRLFANTIEAKDEYTQKDTQ